MNACFTAVGLLAQITRWRRLGDGFRQSGPRADLSDLMPLFIALALIGIAIAVGTRLYNLRDYKTPCDSPRKLFRELCDAHRLDISSRRLLLKLASALGMPQPAALFVTPGAFRRSELPPELHHQAGHVLALARQLFGDSGPSKS